jgi:hypothetical protein
VPDPPELSELKEIQRGAKKISKVKILKGVKDKNNPKMKTPLN